MINRIANGRTDLVFDWISQGGSPSSTDEDGFSLLQWCSYYGDVSAIRFLLANGAELKSLGENLGLNGAAFHGHWRLCEFLLEQGADPNGPLDDTGETPLHSAISSSSRMAMPLVVNVLLKHRADPNRVTKPGVETGAFMRDCRTKGETPLHRAAAFGDEVTIQQLLDSGARREARDVLGDTPFSWRSWYGRPDSLLQLLCYGEFSIHPGRETMDFTLLGRPCP